MQSLLAPEEIERIERDFANGVPARFIVELFQPLGVKLSEATFRKYVQVGLLPRSRRVGRKGKHRGSQGLYPVGVVRRINLIKQMMAEGLTLEDIRRSFVYYRNEIEELERVLGTLLGDFDRELASQVFGTEARRELERSVEEVRTSGKQLVQRLEHLASQLVAGQQHGVSDERSRGDGDR